MCSSNTVLSSLKMEGIRLLFNVIDACIGQTCNTTRVQHDSIITCASSYRVYYHYLASPHSFLQQATLYIRLRNVFQGQRCEKQRNEF
jgi:histidinol-phosphate/aromatic aminotransferase/cobyric acid decarboxylase-like protein